MYGILMVARLKHLEIVLVQRPIFVYGNVKSMKRGTEHVFLLELLMNLF